MTSRIGRKARTIKLETLETRKVFAANMLVLPQDAVASEPPAEVAVAVPDVQARLCVASGDYASLAAKQDATKTPFTIRRNNDKITIVAKQQGLSIVVTKLRGKRLQVTATESETGRHVQTEIVSLKRTSKFKKRVKEIVFQGTSGPDWFENTTSISTNAHGGEGNDTLRGGSGKDRLVGGGDEDHLYGGGGADDLRGMAGIDWIYGGPGHDEIDGGDNRDYLFGEGGRDTIHGGAGNDSLEGGGGRDHLYGERDADELRGGKGQDYFYYKPGEDKLLDATRRDILRRQ